MAGKRAIYTVTSKQRAAIQALANGGTVQDAAAAAGVHERTIYKWRKEPAFLESLRTADIDNLRTISRKLTRASEAALGILIKAMADSSAPHSVRVRAAVAILEQRTRFYEVTSMIDELAALKAELANRGAA